MISRSSRTLEVLAPAGNLEALQAALEAGADAVYLGLRTLNARRRARNFSQEEFVRGVKLCHDRKARAYLTLNIDLSQREIGQAARILELARQAKADAVLVRDPAMLALLPHYPELEFHFSTQACIANSADVEAARELGVRRVVLARELSLDEISRCSAIPEVQTEVFVQGALCFCVSGRCLLSSWAGGRSGNRGACTSPCRVPYTVDAEPVGTPLSMRDLCAVHRLADLAAAGVRALKIEGRLKTAQWVGRAVSLYRRALAGEDPRHLLAEASQLGAYTGRQLTSDYLDGRRDELTAVAQGRIAAPRSAQPEQPAPDQPAGDQPERFGYALTLTVQEGGILCRCEAQGFSVEWIMPRSVVRRAHKATPIGELLSGLAKRPLQNAIAETTATNDPAFLLVPRAVNSFFDRLSAALHQLRKQADDELVRIDLPPAVRAAIASPEPSPANARALGDPPDRVRLQASNAAAFLNHVRATGDLRLRPESAVVEGLSAATLPKILASARGMPVVAALPQVMFEEDLAGARELLGACAAAGVAVEVNTWGGWKLAREFSLPMEAGPGLPVLNALAARVLGELGFRSVTLSVEADRRQLEGVAAHCSAPASLCVFGRPALMFSRAQLPRQYLNQPLEDRRQVRLVPRLEGRLWVLRPQEAFDLRDLRNERIRVAHLVVDLVASPDPLREWMGRSHQRSFRFNYGRALA